MGQTAESLRFDKRNGVARQQVVKHLGILPRYGGSEHGDLVDQGTALRRRTMILWPPILTTFTQGRMA